MEDFLFVYGSLKSKFCNNDLLRENGYFVCHAKTNPFYRMYDYGDYPALVKDTEGIAIEGELWNIKDFKTLDTFESVLYNRELIFLAEPCVLAHTYFFVGQTKDLSDCGPIWMKGYCNGGIQVIE